MLLILPKRKKAALSKEKYGSCSFLRSLSKRIDLFLIGDTRGFPINIVERQSGFENVFIVYPY